MRQAVAFRINPNKTSARASGHTRLPSRIARQSVSPARVGPFRRCRSGCTGPRHVLHGCMAPGPDRFRRPELDSHDLLLSAVWLVYLRRNPKIALRHRKSERRLEFEHRRSGRLTALTPCGGKGPPRPPRTQPTIPTTFNGRMKYPGEQVSWS